MQGNCIQDMGLSKEDVDNITGEISQFKLINTTQFKLTMWEI